ncbi:septum formation family protein [Yinghuangia seranimata]|uniref:septum formation family protein n=1 Tax=Yinghuangia seranimata TaxID=408067 RepID=UPI00248C2B06|nr:septum formation family protein [Yinghuangia seranimata]MDI2127886.1 septum formation family protein [Yinghuangia seranimata]
MRSSRALRISAAAAAGLFAATALTGCLGTDDDKDKKGAGSPTPSTVLSAPAAPTAPAAPAASSGKPAGSPGATASSPAGGTAAKPSSGTSTGDTRKVGMNDFKTGDCVNQLADRSEKTDCAGPHDAEVVGVATLAANQSPTSFTYEKDTSDKCHQIADPVVARQAAPADFGIIKNYPTADSWLNANDRTLSCMVHRKDNAKITGKLK